MSIRAKFDYKTDFSYDLTRINSSINAEYEAYKYRMVNDESDTVLHKPDKVSISFKDSPVVSYTYGEGKSNGEGKGKIKSQIKAGSHVDENPKTDDCIIVDETEIENGIVTRKEIEYIQTKDDGKTVIVKKENTYSRHSKELPTVKYTEVDMKDNILDEWTRRY